VSISASGGDARVPEQLLNHAERHPSHREMGSERMPENMPCDSSQTNPLAHVRQSTGEPLVIERLTIGVQEDVSRGLPPFVQGLIQIDVEGDMSLPVVLCWSERLPIVAP
jgi:hypothetical protein